MHLTSRSPAPPRARKAAGTQFVTVAVAAIVLLALVPATALAGKASSGQLLFFPCTNCHPVTMVPGATPGSVHPSRPLPNNFQGHDIVLEGHDALGKGQAACLTCHDDPTRNPGMLKLADGSLVALKSADLSQDPEVALVCYRCHQDKYRDWKAGVHGKHKPSCVAGGCHDPHTPQYIYASPLPPFLGVGFQFKVLPTREPFRALPPPAPNPAVIIPGWFFGIVALGVLVAGSLAGLLVAGRYKR